MTNVSHEIQLPTGWLWTTFKNIAKDEKHAIVDGPFGSQMKVAEFTDAGIPVIEMQNLTGYLINPNFRRFIPEQKYIEIKRSAIQSDDVIVSKTGTLGRVSIVPKTITKAIITSRLAKISVDQELIDLRYTYHYLEYLRINKWWEEIGKGSTMKVLTIKNIANTEIPLPPLPEQHRIVAKIEELFTRLDAGVKAMNHVQAQLKCYHQSVLKAAVEGKLTAGWREQHKNELEPADNLLKRILKERREKWEEEQLARYEAKGRKLPKNWRDKYKKPICPDMKDLPELPEGWKWVSIDQISYEVRYGSSSRTNMDTNGIPVLRMGNIVDGNLVFDKLKYLPENHNEFPDLILVSGDLLFNRTNSVELVGKTAVYNGYPYPCSYASYLIRVRFSRGVEPHFISFFINSIYGRAWIRSVVSQQVGQANVNGTKLKNLAIPLPPFDEQMNIVSELERLFSIIDESESIINKEINSSESFRQSILKRAFEGKLVQQDPNDLPASVLLERIKAEKATSKKSKQLEMF